MKTTFAILHTNDLHSNLIGLGPAAHEADLGPDGLGKTLSLAAQAGCVPAVRVD